MPREERFLESILGTNDRQALAVRLPAWMKRGQPTPERRVPGRDPPEMAAGRGGTIENLAPPRLMKMRSKFPKRNPDWNGDRRQEPLPARAAAPLWSSNSLDSSW